MNETTQNGNGRYLQLARDAFSGSTTYFDSSIRPAVEAALRQFQGVHPVNSRYLSDAYKAKSRVFRPKTRTTIRKNEAVAAEAFFSTADVVTVSCADEDNPRQRASAEVKQALLNYRLKKSIPWFLTVIGAYQSAQTVGVCISYQYWKYDAKKKIDKPCIDLVPIENFRLDPGADWADPINTSPYLIHMLPMRVMDVRGRMKNPDPTTGQPRWNTLEDSAILAAQQSYSDSTRQTRERGRTDSTEQSNAINEFAIVWVHRNIMEIDGVDMVFYTLGTQHLLSKPVPLREAYWTDNRPFVMGSCVIEAHKLYADGIPGITKDVQAEINTIANQRIDNVKLAMDKRYFVSRNAQVDTRSLTRNTPGSVTMMNNPEKDVVVQSTPDVTSSAYQEQDRLNLDFDDVAGAFSQSSVNSNRKLNETVGGLKLLTADTNQISNYQLRTFVETWVEPVLHQVLALESAYETDEVILALAGKAAKLLETFPEEATQEGFIDSILEEEVWLTVNVGIGATNPEDRINTFMKALQNLRELLADGVLERFGLNVAEVIKEVFGKLGYKDGDRFFGSGEDDDPRLASAKATIEQLRQELAQKVSPELIAAQIKKIDAEIDNLAAKTMDAAASKLEKNMRSIFSAMQAGQVVATVREVAPVADELIMAAGGLPPAPGAIDPNFPAPDMPSAALVQKQVMNKKTGIEFVPGAPGDTTPMTPADPASPQTGANQGIETMEADS
jgi:hypothetical protein